jgi:transposase
VSVFKLKWYDLKAVLEKKKINSRSIVRINQEADVLSCKVKDIGISYLYKQAYQKMFGKLPLGLSSADKDLLADLVTMRIIMPTSNLRMANVADNFGFSGLTVNKIYKMMDNLSEENITTIKKHIFQNTKKLLGENDNIKVMFYDLTTIYFEANTADDLKEFGFSKDGKSQHVQISLALIVTKAGLPIGYEIFKGNSFEGSTLIPTLTKLKEQYRVQDVTIVADSAMLSNANIKALIAHNFSFIVAARIKNMKQDITNNILASQEYQELSPGLKCKIISLDNIRLISCYSEDRKRKDEYDRQVALKKISQLVNKSSKANLKGSLKKPYVEIKGSSKIEINAQKLEKSAKFDGYFGFMTNTDLSPGEVINYYRGLWQVEQTFRITKHNLKIRPVYHFVSRRIKAHFAICYLSLALIRSVEYKLKQKESYIPTEQLHILLNQIKQVNLIIGDNECKLTTDFPDELKSVFIALKIPLPKSYSVTKANL